MVLKTKLTYSQKISCLLKSRRNSRGKSLCVAGNQSRRKTLTLALKSCLKLAENMMNLKLQPQLPPKEKKALCLYNDASDGLDVISWLIDPDVNDEKKISNAATVYLEHPFRILLGFFLMLDMNAAKLRAACLDYDHPNINLGVKYVLEKGDYDQVERFILLHIALIKYGLLYLEGDDISSPVHRYKQEWDVYKWCPNSFPNCAVNYKEIKGCMTYHLEWDVRYSNFVSAMPEESVYKMTTCQDESLLVFPGTRAFLTLTGEVTLIACFQQAKQISFQQVKYLMPRLTVEEVELLNGNLPDDTQLKGWYDMYLIHRQEAEVRKQEEVAKEEGKQEPPKDEVADNPMDTDDEEFGDVVAEERDQDGVDVAPCYDTTLTPAEKEAEQKWSLLNSVLRRGPSTFLIQKKRVRNKLDDDKRVYVCHCVDCHMDPENALCFQLPFELVIDNLDKHGFIRHDKIIPVVGEYRGRLFRANDHLLEVGFTHPRMYPLAIRLKSIKNVQKREESAKVSRVTVANKRAREEAAK